MTDRIDLAEFADRGSFAYYRPVHRERGIAYATTGAWIAWRHEDGPDTDDPILPARNIIDRAEAAWPLAVDFSPIPAMDEAPRATCVECGGTGKEKADCPRCNGTGDCECECGDEHSCHECGGDGTRPGSTATFCAWCCGAGTREGTDRQIVESVPFDGRRLRALARMGARIALTRRPGLVKGNPGLILFEADDIRGILMPLRTAKWRADR